MNPSLPARVLIALTVAPPGGAGTYAVGLLGGLTRAAVPAKDRIVVLVAATWAAAHAPLVDEARAAGLVVDERDVPPPGTWKARLTRGGRVRRAARLHGADVVFVPRDSAPWLRTPSVILARNRYAWESFESTSGASATAAVGGRLSAVLLRWSALVGARRAARVLAVSRVMADTVERSSGGTVHVDGVVHHGCSLPPFERYPDHAEVPCESGPSGAGEGGAGERPVVAIVANLIANKGIETVIDAVGRVGASGRSWDLRVYGKRQDADYADLLEERAQRVLGGSVLQGPAYDEDLIAAYRAADVLVVGGTFESFCFPLLEGMRLGCVVVAPEGPLVRELCGETAVTYAEGDAASLAAALEVAWAERVERSRAGVARSLEFTWERCAEETIDHVRAAVSPSRSGR